MSSEKKSGKNTGKVDYRFKDTEKSDPLLQKINSAKLFIRNDTTNKIVELNLELEKLRVENKTLKRIQAREEAAYTKLENVQIDMKKTIKKHVEEINNLRLELEKAWEHNKKLTANLILKDDELRSLKKKYNLLTNSK